MIAQSLRSRVGALVTAAAIVAAGAFVSSTPAHAAPTPTTVRFEFTRSTQLFTVPAGVTSLLVEVAGASGATPGGGRGASFFTPIDVTPGQQLYVTVGGSDGYNGGTVGSILSGGAGGGATDIRTVAPTAPDSLSSRLVVAGGGGGRGATAQTVVDGRPVTQGDGGTGGDAAGVLGGLTAGGGASLSGFANSGGAPGGRATATAGGARGAGGAAPLELDQSGGANTGANGAPGTFGAGGAANGGGGGGGGWYGGGGGGGGGTNGTSRAGGGGGGGGSSYVASSYGTSFPLPNTGQGYARITYQLPDTTAPVITVSDVIAEATGPDGAAVQYTATATDEVDGAVVVTCDPPSGSVFAIGTTGVDCTARDAAGNVGSRFFGVGVFDTTSPVFDPVSDITAPGTSIAGAAVVYPTPTAQDAVGGLKPVTCAPASGSTFPFGTTTVTCTTSDRYDNVGRTAFAVDVRDNTLPVISGPPPAAVVGEPYTYTYTYTSLSPAVLQSLVVPPETGALRVGISGPDSRVVISGTPDGVGSFDLEIAVRNAAGTTTRIDTITVVPADASPTVTTQPQSTTVAAGSQASFTAAASGYPAPDVQWQRSNDGATWSPISGATTTVYSLTATTADDGARFRAVFANRAGTVTSDPATLTVQTPPTITAAPPAGVVGQAYTTNLVVTGSPTPTVAVTSGSLPPGLVLSAAGVLSGTPTTAGSFPVTFTATSAAGSASAPATIVISPATATKADLAVTVTAPGGKAGTKTTWTVTVRNTGPATATSVCTTLLAPKGVTITGVSSKGTRIGQSAVWTAGSIASGATVTYTVAVTLARSGSGIVVAGTGSAKTPDPRLLNNVAAVTVKIAP